jgi:hypothetical protein
MYIFKSILLAVLALVGIAVPAHAEPVTTALFGGALFSGSIGSVFLKVGFAIAPSSGFANLVRAR